MSGFNGVFSGALSSAVVTTNQQLTWDNQTIWYIDNSTGNDTNNGLTSDTALKTHQELRKRLNTPLYHNIDVYFIGNVTEKFDPSSINTTDFFTVYYHGVRTQLATGTITTVQIYNSTTKDDGQITDSSKANNFWAAYVGKLIVLTSGANAGAWGWVAKDLGTKKCRFSPFWSDDSFYVIDPAINDSYAIYDLTNVTNAITARCDGTVWFKDLSFTNVNLDSGSFQASSCSFTSLVIVTDQFCDFMGCSSSGDILSNGFNAACLLDAFFVGTRIHVVSGNFILFSPGLIQGIIAIEGGGQLDVYDNWALFDFTSIPISVFMGRNSGAYLNGIIYGSTASSYTHVIQIDGSCGIIASSNSMLPNITAGTTSYAKIGGTNKTAANLSVSFVNTTNNAMFVYPTT